MIVTEENMDWATPIFDTMGPMPVYTEPKAKPLTSSQRKRFTRQQNVICLKVSQDMAKERAARDAEPLLTLTAAYRVLDRLAVGEPGDDGRKPATCDTCGEKFNPQTAPGDVPIVRHEESGAHTIGYTKALCHHHNLIAVWGDDEGMCTNCGQMLPGDPETGDGSRPVIDTPHGKIFAADGELEAVWGRFTDESAPDVVVRRQVWLKSTIKVTDNRGAEPIGTIGGVPVVVDPDVPGTVYTPPQETVKIDRADLVRRIATEQEARVTGQLPRIEEEA